MLGNAGLTHAQMLLDAADVPAAGGQQAMDNLQAGRVGQGFQQFRLLLVVYAVFHGLPPPFSVFF